MKKLLSKYGYLFYLGLTTWIFTPYGISSLRWWTILIVMFFMIEKIAVPAWTEHIRIYGDVKDRIDKDFLKKFGWVLVLGFITTWSVPIKDLLGALVVWCIIYWPTLFLSVYKCKFIKY